MINYLHVKKDDHLHIYYLLFKIILQSFLKHYYQYIGCN